MYYAANIKNDEGKELCIEAVKEVPEKEVIALFQKFNYTAETQPMNKAYKIMVRNANEYLVMTSEKVLIDRYFNKNETLQNISDDANRLIFNFCASMQSYIDYAEKAVAHKGNDSSKGFKAFLSSLFDNELSYRFFYKLRNYTIHYSFPYTNITVTNPKSIELICSKEHLMQYTGWGAIVSKDLNNMSDVIDLRSFINPLLEILTAIQLHVYYFYVEDIFNANKAIGLFNAQYGLSVPTILEVDEQGANKIRPFPLDTLKDDINMLQSHPSINASFVDNISKIMIKREQE